MGDNSDQRNTDQIYRRALEIAIERKEIANLQEGIGDSN